MYFAQFPKIYYDFPQDESSTTLQILTDITTNVRVRKQVLENITLYDEYDMMDGETPEIVAEKVYGNAELHWVIMLVNQRYDYLRDFPMSSRELEEHVIELYGKENIYSTHHYERDKIIVEAIANLVVPKSIIDVAKINDFVFDFGVNSRIQAIDEESKTLTLVMDSGIFKTGRLVSLNGIRKTESGELKYVPVSQFVVGVNAFSLNENYSPISNYDYETRLNEKKRTIKLISPQLINQFVNEYMSLVTPT
jgi:hypothetical protein